MTTSGQSVSRKLLVVGSAMCVWRDIIAARELGTFDAVAVVNDMGTEYEDRIDYWCTLHHEKFLRWQTIRKEHGFNTDYIAVTHEKPDAWELGQKYPRIDKVIKYQYHGMNASGSSGHYAAKVGLDEGFDRIVLAGVPMLASEKHFNDNHLWHERDSFVQAWQFTRPIFRGKVKSLSGWTRDLLGAPTSSWLAGGQE